MLSLRLAAIAALIEKGDVVADIGSDHGLLPLYLAGKGYSDLYASENKKGPYNRLKKAVNAYSSDIIEVDLADGLEKLPARINTVVIAGMGGDLIASILSAHPHKLDSVNKLILAPNSNAQTLRRTLNFIGFSISYEEIVEEKGQFYEIIIAHNKPCHVCSIETKFGSYNLRNKSETFIKMWNDVYEQNKRLLNNENLPEVRRKEILEEQSLIENVIKRGEKT